MTSSDPKQCPDTLTPKTVSWEVFLVGTVDNATLFCSRGDKGRKKLHPRGEMCCATCPWGWRMLLAQVVYKNKAPPSALCGSVLQHLLHVYIHPGRYLPQAAVPSPISIGMVVTTAVRCYWFPPKGGSELVPLSLRD